MEVVRDVDLKNPPRCAVFDFDGTLSLIRQGWPNVMVPMMVEALKETGTSESDEELTELAMTFVTELTGQQTIYQMIRLGQEVSERGNVPLDPLSYKRCYQQRLMERIKVRREALRSGSGSSEEMLVPYSLEALRGLQEREVELYLASGTDESYVIEEAQLLGLDVYFGDNIYGAVDNYETFSKRMLIGRILEEKGIGGSQLMGFGDGYVEIENTKSVGGIAIAVASDEAHRSGRPDPWKRDRLVGIGADIVIPDFRDYAVLFNYLWKEA